MPFLHHHTHDDSQASPAGEPDDGRWRAKVLTVSDGVVAGTREDKSGAALVDRLGRPASTWSTDQVTEDGIGPVAHALRHLAEGFAGLVVTTGGTGFGPRDLTPEGTKEVIWREAPGLAEAMRAVSPLGRLSRGVAGTVGQSLIAEPARLVVGGDRVLDAIVDVVPHALDLLTGGRPH